MYKRLLFLLLACPVWPAWADEPLPPPARTTVCSHSGKFCVVSDPSTQKTIITRQGMPSPLWTIPGWHRWLILTEDGQSVVVGYDGLNLVPKDAALTTPVLLFYGPSGLIKSVSLSDLYRSKAEMRATVSHYEWEQSVELDTQGRLVVQKVGGSEVVFDLRNGVRVLSR